LMVFTMLCGSVGINSEGITVNVVFADSSSSAGEESDSIYNIDADELKADYQKAISALNESKFKYEAAKNLYEEGAISKEEYIRAENAYKNDMITVNSLNVADKVNIKSPIAGTVTRVNVNIGRYANDTENNEPMFVVEDLQKLKMDVGISEYDISKIQVGQKVTITAEVLGNDSVEEIGEKKEIYIGNTTD
jgi:HlyD family secretion protein